MLNHLTEQDKPKSPESREERKVTLLESRPVLAAPPKSLYTQTRVMQCPHPIKAEAVFKSLTSLSFLSGTGVCFLMLFPV